ncbi:MAG: hypothetical protein K0B11_07605 [Mariniphaga sp.]|nr:hypothetical protein [Mariniphaga sp.]
MKQKLHLWDAIREMREATGRNETFSMVFMSLDRSRGKNIKLPSKRFFSKFYALI